MHERFEISSRLQKSNETMATQQKVEYYQNWELKEYTAEAITNIKMWVT